MRARSRTLRWLVPVLIAVVFLAAILHGGSISPLALLVPLLVFFQLAIVTSVPRFDCYAIVLVSPALPIVAPRPPPVN